MKVLDFGLAKALSADASAPDVTRSPTITAAATQAGVVLGTAAYMSPEQARGRAVDKRSDIWSFGVVLYEMLTGTRCFEGETVSDVLAAVLRQEPDWSKLPANTPPQVRTLLGRCFERDPKKRLRDIGDAWLEGTAAPATPVERKASASVWPRAATVFVALAALALGFAAARWLAKPAPPAKAAAIHSVVPLPPGTRLSGWASPIVAISRDGRTLAFVAEKEGEPQRLYVHRLDRDDTRVVPDSASAEGPFFSPDGQWVGFATNVSQVSRTGSGDLRKYSLATGLTQKIADIPDFFGANWSIDGTIVVAVSTTEGVWRFPPGGGPPDTSAQTALVQGKPVRRRLWWPEWLTPSDVLVTEEGDSSWGGAAAFALPTRTLSSIEKGVLFSRYASNGCLLMSRRDRTLFSAPFDARTLRTSGPPVAVLRDVAFGCNGAAAMAVSENGTLVYASGYVRGSLMDLSRLARIGSKGEVEMLPFDPDSFGRVAMPSPDGRSLAVITTDGSVWVYDLARRIRRALPLGNRRSQGYAVSWSPDGRSISYSASSEGSQGWGIYRQAADGSGVPEELVPPGEEAYALAFAPDGSSFVSTEFAAHPGLSRRSLNGKKRSVEDRGRLRPRRELFTGRAMARLRPAGLRRLAGPDDARIRRGTPRAARVGRPVPSLVAGWAERLLPAGGRARTDTDPRGRPPRTRCARGALQDDAARLLRGAGRKRLLRGRRFRRLRHRQGAPPRDELVHGARSPHVPGGGEMTLAAGTKLGPYEILSPIGAGGMGEVYRARDTRLERTVAVKVLPSHMSASRRRGSASSGRRRRSRSSRIRTSARCTTWAGKAKPSTW